MIKKKGRILSYLGDKTSLLLFIVSILFLTFGYGVAVGAYKIFPYHIITLAEQGYQEVKKQLFPMNFFEKKGDGNAFNWLYPKVDATQFVPIRNTEAAYQGENLVTRLALNNELAVDIIDMDGKTIHSWNVDWFRIWPDAEHLPTMIIPKSKPGTHVHGAVVMEDGGLVFNFEHLGLVRLNRESKVVWRLPYRTHHSIHRHDDGHLWVCGQKRRKEVSPYFPKRKTPYDEYTLLEISPQGEIINEWSVQEILGQNGYNGLLNFKNTDPSFQTLDDRLHLNDVEPFPLSLKEDFFQYGDVMVSLRNINTVFIFNRDSGIIKYITTGRFTQQHDPDFIDGNTFSVFDNIYSTADSMEQRSRILIFSAREDQMEVYFEGSKDKIFSTAFMGKHQWLPNGNLLMTESLRGRALEIDKSKNIVWEYVNFIGDGIAGMVEEVTRLPHNYSYFQSNKK